LLIEAVGLASIWGDSRAQATVHKILEVCRHEKVAMKVYRRKSISIAWVPGTHNILFMRKEKEEQNTQKRRI